MKWCSLWLLAFCLSGCASKGPSVASNVSTGLGPTTGGARETNRVAGNDVRGKRAHDAQPQPPADGPLVAQLEVYQLAVPFGAISRNDEFWKHVDETRLDPATYDLLIRNGIRLGIGENSDWKYFKELIDNYHAGAQKGIAGVTQEGAIELMMKTGVDYQDLFYFDSHNVLWGRTFEYCDDLLSISFYPHQRAEGDTVIKLCPLVRALRKQFVFSVLNEERERIELRRPELLIDLRAQTQVPADHFLVFGPSRLSELPSSAGRNFLVKSGTAEPIETVLILVPKAYRVGSDSVAVPVSSTTR